MRYVIRILVLVTVVTTLVIGDSLAALVQEAWPSPVPPYTIIELDTPEREVSRAFGINDLGWVAGYAYDAQDRQRAVLWKDGDLVDLGTLGGDQATAVNVNNRGQVVGSSTTVPGAALGDPGSHAFLWESGRMRTLGTLGGDLSIGLDVNERGQVVGTSTTAAGQSLDWFVDGPHAFLWEDGRMIDLGTLEGERSAAFAINEAGQVVGTAQTANGADHAFLWEDGRMTDLGMLGGDQSVAFGINTHGQIVGGSTSATGQEFGESGTQAFRWEAQVMTLLGNTSESEGIAFGINDRGEIVGNDPEVGAVLWHGREAVSLTALLPNGSGWEGLGLARAINEQGQIVGWGQRDGTTRAFIASPATPGAMPASALPGSTSDVTESDLDAVEVVVRAQRAIQDARTYRFQMFSLDAGDGDPFRLGEVEIGRGSKTQAADGSDLEYFDGQTLYFQRPGGKWIARVPPYDQSESLLGFLDTSPDQWELKRIETIDGQPSYLIEQTVKDRPGHSRTQTLWIDAATFLPHKLTSQDNVDGFEPFWNVTVYSDFGAPVDVSPPAEALAPTPTPEPLPETSGGTVTIALRDIYFEPEEVTIPADEDVVIVLPNEGVTIHNFSIEEFGISVDVEWGTTGHVVVNLPPGIYEFHCDVPGHTEAGQVGTLTVRE